MAIRESLFMGREGVEWMRVPDSQTVLIPRAEGGDETPLMDRRIQAIPFQRRYFVVPVFVEAGCAPTDEQIIAAVRGTLPESESKSQFVPPRGQFGGTRAEHLEWCKGRAIEYVDAGELEQAFASMMSDLTKHDETRRSAEGAMGGLGLMLMTDGALKSPEKMRRFIEGFR